MVGVWLLLNSTFGYLDIHVLLNHTIINLMIFQNIHPSYTKWTVASVFPRFINKNISEPYVVKIFSFTSPSNNPFVFIN